MSSTTGCDAMVMNPYRPPNDQPGSVSSTRSSAKRFLRTVGWSLFIAGLAGGFVWVRYGFGSYNEQLFPLIFAAFSVGVVFLSLSLGLTPTAPENAERQSQIDAPTAEGEATSTDDAAAHDNRPTIKEELRGSGIGLAFVGLVMGGILDPPADIMAILDSVFWFGVIMLSASLFMDT